MSKAAISLENLSYRYDPLGTNAVSDISLEIPEGNITAILGPNGAGKTTLLNLFLGLYQPGAGQLLVAGKSYQDYSRREISQLVSLVPQTETTPFNLSVLEYVLLGRAPYLDPLQMPKDDDYQIALNSLHTLGILHLQDRPIPELSGGEHQIVLIARALAQQTQILILDEPTAHLDLGNQKRILALLQELASQSITIAFTTHDPNTAAFIADWVILIRQGRIMGYGGVEVVMTEEKLAAIYDTSVLVENISGRKVILLK